jgi:hypothetical protein
MALFFLHLFALGFFPVAVLFFRLFIINRRQEKLNSIRDGWLDYVLRRYALHTSDPYVVRPHYEEKRCFHCNYPLGEHDADCAWALLRPLTRQLYPAKSPKF